MIVNNSSYSHICFGQIQSDRAQSFWSILDVAQESHDDIHNDNHNHALIQNTVVTTERGWSLHVVLQSYDLTQRKQVTKIFV